MNRPGGLLSPDYYDFAGYSNMAIGLGRIFGFAFPRNFNDPYSASSITEFWRRWHMALSRWLRDWLYIPLGGNRRGPTRTYLNLTLVLVLCGFWHGAAWTFIAWGAWHGAFLIVERMTGLSRLGPVGLPYALLVVTLGWVFFRAPDMGVALDYFAALSGAPGDGAFAMDLVIALMPTFLLASALGVAFALTRAAWRKRLVARLGRDWPGSLATQSALGALFTLSMLSVAAGAYNPFLYFRF